MQSAYGILGISSQSTGAEIEAAYQRALESATRQQGLDANVTGARVDDIRHAYRVLIDPQLRAAHDRKLAENSLTSVRPVIVREERGSGGMGRLVLIVIGLAIVVGGYVHYSREQARREAAALELRKEQLRIQQEEMEQRRLAADEATRARERRDEDLRQRAETNAALSRATMMESVRVSAEAQAQRNAEADARRREYEARAEEARRSSEAARQVAADQQRIRELCYQNYRRANC